MDDSKIKKGKKVLYGMLLSAYAKIGGKLQSDRIVYKLKDPSKLVTIMSRDVEIRSFSHRNEIREEIKASLLKIMGPKYSDVMDRLFSEGARLYILFFANEVASLIWTKFGKDIHKWMIPLEEYDIVFFSGYTNPKLRGRRLWGQVIAAAYTSESHNSPNFYTDCNINNLPSRRQFERTGFDVVARSKLPKVKK